MAENRLNMPSGMGGLMRYDAEYSSRFMISPSAVVGFVIFVAVFVVLLKIFVPVI